MAASDSEHPHSPPPAAPPWATHALPPSRTQDPPAHAADAPAPRAPHDCLTAPALDERLREEIARAARHGSALGCLLVEIEDLPRIERAHGPELSAQALAHVGLALCREFRSFDRVGRAAEDEFVVVLPGVDAARGEVVARRALARLHAIKIEAQGQRRALRVSIGIAAWRDGLSAEQLVERAREANARETSLGSAADALRL